MVVHEDASDDDAPPVAISLSSSRAAALTRDAGAPSQKRYASLHRTYARAFLQSSCQTRPLAQTFCACIDTRTHVLLFRSVREAQKAAKKKQADTVTAHARGDDGFLPADVLNSLPSTSLAGSGSGAAAADGGPAAAGQADAEDMYSAAVARAKAKARAKAEAAAAKAAPRDGLPKVVTRAGNVEVAVLPPGGGGLGGGGGGGGIDAGAGVGGAAASSRGGGGSGGGGPRMHAPVKQDVRDFMQQQLYGAGRHQRVAAATLSALKPSGGRYGAASNFASVAAPPPSSDANGGSAKKRKRGAAGNGGKQLSSLEKMAAQIMARNRKKS